MIDWVSAILPVNTRVPYSGINVQLCPDGEILNETSLPATVTGSYSSTVTCCNVWADRSKRGNPVPPGSRIAPTYVWISGNPAKYLQGHNIYGSDDLSKLCSKFFEQVATNLGLDSKTVAQWAHIGLALRFELTRIDITYNYRVEGGSQAVNKWIKAAHQTSRISHKNASQLKGSTLYFGKHSRRHTLKIYNKRQDLDAHPIDKMLLNHSAYFGSVYDSMLEDADGLLRVEQTFRAKKLREMGFDRNCFSLNKEMVTDMFNKGISTLNISANIMNNVVSKQVVGSAVYSTYLAWSAGLYDDQSSSRATHWRHRKALLPYGIDISLNRQDVGNAQVIEVPLIQTITAVPASAPSFYYDYGLLACA